VTELGNYAELIHDHESSRVLLPVKEGTRYAFPNAVKYGQRNPAKFGSKLAKVLLLVENGHLEVPSLSIRPICELNESFAEARRRYARFVSLVKFLNPITVAHLHCLQYFLR
jgi:hypothetical protein